MINHYGEVVEVVPGRGVYVEAMIGGKIGRYGPMHYLSNTGARLSSGDEVEAASIEIDFVPGDRVLFTSVGRIADAFIILGKVIDPGFPPVYGQPDLGELGAPGFP